MENNCKIEEGPKNFKDRIKSCAFRKTLIGIVLGGLGGFLYYYFIGCSTGSCGIASNPYYSTLWGSLFGFLIVKSPCRKCN